VDQSIRSGRKSNVVRLNEAGLRSLVRGILRENLRERDPENYDHENRVMKTTLHPSRTVTLEEFMKERIEDFFSFNLDDTGMEDEDSMQFEIHVGPGNLLEVELYTAVPEGSDYLEGQVQNYEDDLPGPQRDATIEKVSSLIQKHRPGKMGAFEKADQEQARSILQERYTMQSPAPNGARSLRVWAADPTDASSLASSAGTLRWRCRGPFVAAPGGPSNTPSRGPSGGPSGARSVGLSRGAWGKAPSQKFFLQILKGPPPLLSFLSLHSYPAPPVHFRPQPFEP
jgi:hypothetical protein